MYKYLKYFLISLAIMSFLFEVYLAIFADYLLDKRLFVLNMMFLHIIALPATLIILPAMFGISLLLGSFFPDAEAPFALSRLLGHFIFVLFVYLQWFVIFPKIYLWYKNKKK